MAIHLMSLGPALSHGANLTTMGFCQMLGTPLLLPLYIREGWTTALLRTLAHRPSYMIQLESSSGEATEILLRFADGYRRP